MSGQCLLSSVIGNRSANKGICAQPCRMKYSLFDFKNNEILKEKYLLSKKDIYGLEYINKLKEIGVSSLKIEGRNKSAEYVLGVTKTYRKYIDSKKEVNLNDKYVLKQLFNRDGLSDGYLSGVKYKDSISLASPKNKGIYIGEVISTYKKYVKIKLEQDISMHDGIEIYSDGNIVSNIITCIKDENGNILNNDVEKGNYVFIRDFNNKIAKNSKVYRTSSSKLNNLLKSEYKNTNRQKGYSLLIQIKKNKKINICVKENNINFNYDYIPELSKTKSIVKEDIIKSFSKTNDEPYFFSNLEIILDDNLFIPVSVLNAVRREIIERIKNTQKTNLNEEILLNKMDTVLNNLDSKIKNLKVNSKKDNTLFIYKYSSKINYIDNFKRMYNMNLDIIYINISDYYLYNDEINKKYKGKVKIFLYIQNFIGKNLDEIIVKNIDKFLSEGINGVLLGSFAYIDLLTKLKQKYDFMLYADYSFNITNLYSAYFLNKLGFDKITPSVELTEEEYQKFSLHFNTEFVNDIITAMTSRYCILGSFIGRKDKNMPCKKPCKDIYYLKDTHRCKIFYCM